MANVHFEKHIAVTKADQNAIDVLSKNTELSKSEIKQAMQKGAVWLTRNKHTQRLRRAKKTLQPNDELHIYYDKKILAEQPLTATCIEKNQSYGVWYKPYGVYCQGSKWGDHCTINRQVEQITQQPAYIVHRLDRATTGLILIAYHKKTAAALAQLFSLRQIEKKYLAIVNGQFPDTTEPLIIDKKIAYKKAISRIKRLLYDEKEQLSLIEVIIETGRKHQIRIHLASIGFPIVGDRLYGGLADSDIEQQPDLQLCCYQLAFQCPDTGLPKHYQLDKTLWPSLASTKKPR